MSGEQEWKKNDRAANKSGPRSTVFWVKRNRKHADAERYGVKHSEAKFHAGAKYTGDWQDNVRHGFGTQVWPNGNKYEGDWRRNRRHGKGTFWVKARGGLRKQYTGDWDGNARHGIGKMFYADGSNYEGEWRDGVRHGRGKMIYANSDVYEGDWLDDQRTGPGLLSLSNGDRYEGHWAGDKKHGTGRFFYFATNKMYVGVWENDVAKCGVYSDTPPELSDYQAEDGTVEMPPDAFDLPALGLRDPGSVFRFAAERVVGASRAQEEAAAVRPEEAFTADELEQLRAAFAAGDVAGDGLLAAAQLGPVLEQLHAGQSAEDLEVLREEMGLGGGRRIDFHEFAGHMARLRA